MLYCHNIDQTSAFCHFVNVTRIKYVRPLFADEYWTARFSYLCPVHTYADILKNGGFFLRFGVASTGKRRFRHAKTEVFENALQSVGFRKRCFRVYVWTGENEGFRKR